MQILWNKEDHHTKIPILLSSIHIQLRNALHSPTSVHEFIFRELLSLHSLITQLIHHISTLHWPIYSLSWPLLSPYSTPVGLHIS